MVGGLKSVDEGVEKVPRPVLTGQIHEGSAMREVDPLEALDVRPLDQLPSVGCAHAIKLDQLFSQ